MQLQQAATTFPAFLYGPTAVYLLIGQGVLLLINCFAFGVWLSRRTRRRKINASYAESTPPTVTATVMQMTSPSLTTDMNTVQVTNHEFSIPGAIEVTYGLDYVVGKEIGRGGQGTINKAEVLSPLVARRTQNNPIVVK